MIDKLKIQNFKAFKNELNISFEEKNFLLYGENGSGKSSLFESFKVIFFKSKLELGLPSITPEGFAQAKVDLYNKYNNRITHSDFNISINDIAHNSFEIDPYQVSMLTTNDIIISDKINLEKLLKKCFLPIQDVNSFCQQKHQIIQDLVNGDLVNFQEKIKIELNPEAGFDIKVIDEARNVNSSAEIKKYFNEAKVNLVIVLLILRSIRINENAKSKILVIDDIVSSFDNANRSFFVKFLIDNFSDYQVFLFTHSVSFYNLTSYAIKHSYFLGQKWKFADLYEFGNDSKIFFKDSLPKVDELEAEFKKIKKTANPESDLSSLGNKIRQRFEVLSHQLSKLLSIGAVEESKVIVEQIAKEKYQYFTNDGKTISDLIDDIQSILNEDNINNLSVRIQSKIDCYRKEIPTDLKMILKDLEFYKKIAMNPMSHGVEGSHSFSTKEIETSLKLLKKLETNIKNLVDKSIQEI